MFCGVVVFIGNIKNYSKKSKPPHFGIKILQSEMKQKNLNHHIPQSIRSDGKIGGVYYFNYLRNADETFILLDSLQIFELTQCVKTDYVTGRTSLLSESKHFFTLTMPQVN